MGDAGFSLWHVFIQVPIVAAVGAWRKGFHHWQPGARGMVGQHIPSDVSDGILLSIYSAVLLRSQITGIPSV